MTDPDGFDAATALGAPESARYPVVLHPGWTVVGGKPNGGYLLAVLGRAAVAAVVDAGGAHPHPLAATSTYLSAPDVGPAEVETEVLRLGRSASQVRVRLCQDGLPRVEAVLVVGRLAEGVEPWWGSLPPVEVPPFAACERLGVQDHPGSPFRVPLTAVVEERLDPAVLGFLDGRPGGGPELRGWLRLADGREPDPLVLLLAVDAYPPATFELGTTGWVPTLQLTAYVRALPAPGPLRVRQRARLVQGDLVDEQCEVWDSAGRLVASATQLAGLRVGDTPPPPA